MPQHSKGSSTTANPMADDDDDTGAKPSTLPIAPEGGRQALAATLEDFVAAAKNDDGWRELRESWEKTSGMSHAVEVMTQRLMTSSEHAYTYRASGSRCLLPEAVVFALVQGPKETIAHLQALVSGIALVAALFLVGNLAAISSNPNYTELPNSSTTNPWSEDSFVTGPFATEMCFYACNAVAVGMFMKVIAFYIRTMATTTRAAMARDAVRSN
eukprot:SAG25_NODE_1677_length_2567_cov_2.078606_3_plen_214_part_00